MSSTERIQIFFWRQEKETVLWLILEHPINRFPPTLSHLPPNLSLNLSKIERKAVKTCSVQLVVKAMSPEFCSSIIPQGLSPQVLTLERHSLEPEGVGWEERVEKVKIKSQYWRDKTHVPGWWGVAASPFYENTNITKTASTGESVILEFQLSGICVLQWQAFSGESPLELFKKVHITK